MAATVWSRPNRRSAKAAARETARGWLNAPRVKVHRDTEDTSGKVLLTSSGPNGGERRQRKMQLARAATVRHRLRVVVIA